MANVIKTVLTYQLDGSKRDFNIPFEYLARKFVVVTLIGVDRKVLTINTDYRFATRTTISLTKAWGPADGYTTIELRRVTSTTDRLVDFTDGSILRAYDLNVAQIQTMHVAEEARDLTADTIGVNNDGHLDARGRKIVNLAFATGDYDAVPLKQIKERENSAWNAVIKSEEHANRSNNEANRSRDEADRARREADRSTQQAGVSTAQAVESKTQADRSNSEANRAKGYADSMTASVAEAKKQADRSNSEANRARDEANRASGEVTKAAAEVVKAAAHVETAKGHADRANSEANRSKSEADRAKSEADKLGNYNGLVGALDRVDGTNVYWKGDIHTNGRLYLTSHGFDCGQYQQFFGGVPNRYSVMEWGDKDGWHLYSERQTEGGRPTLNLRGNLSAGFDVRAGVNQFANHMFVHDRVQYWPGAGMFANQLSTPEAPFIKQGRYEAPSGTSFYSPIVKGIIRTAGHGYDTALSFGTLTYGNGSFASAVIHVIGDNGTGGVWEFNPNNRSFRSQGDGFFGSTTIYQDGNIGGPTWGGDLASWLRNNTVNHIAMGGVNWSQLWRAGGVSDGGGKVITGITNSNGDDLVDGCQWRVMQYVRNNGQRFNIY